MAIEVELHRFGVEGRPVVELHPLAQVQDERDCIGELPAFCKRPFGKWLPIVTESDQRVVDTAEGLPFFVEVDV